MEGKDEEERESFCRESEVLSGVTRREEPDTLSARTFTVCLAKDGKTLCVKNVEHP